MWVIEVIASSKIGVQTASDPFLWLRVNHPNSKSNKHNVESFSLKLQAECPSVSVLYLYTLSDCDFLSCADLIWQQERSAHRGESGTEVRATIERERETERGENICGSLTFLSGLHAPSVLWG